MRLAQFIRHAREAILAQSLVYAAQIPALSGSAREVLRNHLPIVLETICLDLEQPQDRAQSIEKSLGHAPVLSEETAAQTHGTLRARLGLDVEQLVAEYRVIRSCVLRLWMEATPPDRFVLEDMLRFNEVIDQAVAESVAFYATEKEKWRNIFLAVLGHDLRDPLSAMLMTAELIERNGQAAHLGGALLRNGRRLAALLDSLLEYSQLALGDSLQVSRTPVDLAVQCREEVEMLQNAFPHQHMVFAATADAQGLFDGSRVRQALSNLVSNAAQHSPRGSTIEVAVTGGPDRVEVVTRNPAAPLTRPVLEGLFEPLQRRAGAGEDADEDAVRHLGLGLFIVREIARAHQGEVHASTGDGCIEFKMCLPKVAGNVPAP